jgi:hypothetical protein
MKVNIDSELIQLQAGKKSLCNSDISPIKSKSKSSNSASIKKNVKGGFKEPIRHTYCISKVDIEKGKIIEFKNKLKCYRGKRPTDAVRKAYNAAMKEEYGDSSNLFPSAIVHVRRATQNKTFVYKCVQNIILNPNKHEIRLGITKTLKITKIR